MRFNFPVRVYFKDKTRPFMYGKFVDMSDGEDLKKKGMVRFMSYRHFDKPLSINNTRIFNISSFKSFTYYETESTVTT